MKSQGGELIMIRLFIVPVLGAVVVILVLLAVFTPDPAPPVKKGYTKVNGLTMYYEIHGEGQPPLVLLHGTYMTIDLNWGKVIPVLAKDRQVIAIEQQGHGRTEDLDRTITYEQMADDTAELLRQKGIKKADVLGYSMGGATAIDLAILHPDLVRKLVIISAAYRRDGWYPAVYTTIENITPGMFTGSGLPVEYARVAPNPDGWPTLVAKMKKLDGEYVGRTPEEFRSIQAPTLIIIGDSDGVPPGHAVEMFTLLGGGVFGDIEGLPRSRLAIVPHTTHVGIMDRADVWLPMVTGFLDEPGEAPARTG